MCTVGIGGLHSVARAGVARATGRGAGAAVQPGGRGRRARAAPARALPRRLPARTRLAQVRVLLFVLFLTDFKIGIFQFNCIFFFINLLCNKI